MLFDEFERTDSSPAAYGEDSFAFLNRADGIVWARIRDVLEQWFSEYPDRGSADLRGRFRSNRPGAHFSAWWELYLHQLFCRLGYDVAVHPEVSGTTRQPDFELSRRDDRLYVEAAVVFSGIVEEGRDATREGWIMDAVDKGKSANFHVGIEFLRLGEKRPRDRDVFRPLEDWLAGLDPDGATRAFERTGEFPAQTFTIDDWELRFEAFPVKPEARGDPEPGRLLGMPQASGGPVDDQSQLRDTLKHKRGRYGSLDAPLVVAVNCVSSFMEDEDIAAALYGSLAIQYHEGAPGSERWVRLRDGAWMDERGPRGRRMSAGLTAVQLHPWTAVREAPKLWQNPWADIPFGEDWPFTTWRSSEKGEVIADGRTVDMASLLGLPSDWPGPESAF